ncbi:MAG: RNA polymerase sigma factor [Clostridiales bacterium]|nr:RNA polymerase sigma factor [Clostridiales bacterium]
MTKEQFVERIDAVQGQLYRISLAILCNDADVQDAMQETVLKAWEKRHTLRNEAFFSTWITRIAINTCRQMIRKNRRIVLMDQLPECPVPSRDVTLKMLVECLPEKLRLPFVLQYSEGMDTAQTAESLHLTQSAVRSRIHRAKLILRKELAENEEASMAAR